MCKDNNFFHNYYREFFFITRHRPKYNGFIYFMTQFQQITTRHCQIRKLITSLGTHSASNSHFQTQKKQLHLCNCLIFRAENETRTRDPNLGKVVLYQLSYFRICFERCKRFVPFCECKYKANIFTVQEIYQKNAFFNLFS